MHTEKLACILHLLELKTYVVGKRFTSHTTYLFIFSGGIDLREKTHTVENRKLIRSIT